MGESVWGEYGGCGEVCWDVERAEKKCGEKIHRRCGKMRGKKRRVREVYWGMREVRKDLGKGMGSVREGKRRCVGV